MKIGNYIKEKRLQKGMTQEDLAIKSDITVRTVQRIESGDVDPRSFTLLAIASALDVDYNELINADLPPISEKISSNESFWIAMLHLSGLLVLIIPTVIIWVKKEGENPNMRSHAVGSINFQISMMIYLIFTAFLCLVPITIAFSPTVKIPIFIAVGILLLTVLGIYISTIVIINSARAANGQLCKYPLSIKFLKI